MSQGGRTKPMFILFALFGLLPAAFILLVFLPVRKRMAVDEARLEAAVKRNQELPSVQPLTAAERNLIEDPMASWRSRMPLVASDSQRLSHYHRVITELQNALQARKVTLLGVRSTWNQIKGSYTLPSQLGAGTTASSSAHVSEPGQLQAWVLEAQIEGSPANLFQALETLPAIPPLLEPVAVRWEASPIQHKQTIILRNLVAAP